jgi:hypothetical protein
MSLNTSEYNITRLIIVSIEIYSCSESKKKPPVVMAVMAAIPFLDSHWDLQTFIQENHPN